jgi:hypothetical protein
MGVVLENGAGQEPLGIGPGELDPRKQKQTAIGEESIKKNQGGVKRESSDLWNLEFGRLGFHD